MADNPLGFPLKTRLVARHVDGDLLLEDRRSGSAHRLNSVAGVIWELCDGAHDAAAITAQVSAVFGQDPADVARDVDGVLAQFAGMGLIQVPERSGKETALLLRSMRIAIGTERPGPIDDLPGDSFDWNYLLKTALLHGVVPPLFKSLAANWPEAVPRTIADQLRGQYDANVKDNQRLLGELLELLGLFEAAGIRAISLKGPVFAVTVYGDVAARQFQDLDIFVSRDQFARAKDVLRARGYKFLMARQMDACAESGDGTVAVDLHCALARRVWSFPIDLDRLWDRLVPISIGQATVWQPQPADHLLILSAHGAKHCWSSVKWIADVAAFLRMHQTVDWTTAVERARSSGGERQLLLAMRLASDVLHVAPPVDVLPAIAADPVVAELATELGQQLFKTLNHPTHQGSYGPIRGGLLYIRTRERARDKVPCALDLAWYPFRWLKYAITPNGHDRAVIALPAPFGFLYYLVRPIRLAMQRGVGRLPER